MSLITMHYKNIMGSIPSFLTFPLDTQPTIHFMSNTLFISRIPESLLSVSKLTSLFSRYGTVIEGKVNIEKHIGWVTMTTTDEGFTLLRLLLCLSFSLSITSYTGVGFSLINCHARTVQPKKYATYSYTKKQVICTRTSTWLG